MTEAELAMEEKLRKKRQEEQEVWQEYLKERALARQKEEDDLRKLKERQQRRKAQRAEQEKLMQEMRRKQEEQHQRDLEERRRKDAEAKRQRLEEAERKRQAMQDAIRKRDEEARRAWSLPKRTDNASVAPVSPLHIGYKDVMKTKEQLNEDKKIAMRFRIKPLPSNLDSMETSDLKRTANDMWSLICQLESDKYDLEEEHKRQEYHLKELSERQKLMNRNKAMKMGLDTEDPSCKFPPKVRLASKYERHVDFRSFGEKTSLFEGGYVDRLNKTKEQIWSEKINQFKESHGDKHVPKWDPSAPRKDVYEPGAIIYEDSDEDDNAELVDKLRNYVEEGKRDEAAAAIRRTSDANRRRSSQLSTASSVSVNVTLPQRQQNATPRQSITSTTSSTAQARVAAQPAAQKQQSAPKPAAEEEEEVETEEEEDEDEEYEEEEEE